LATGITFHDGIGSIGGTKISIHSDGHTVLFDFGLTFDPSGDLWNRLITPRPGAAGLRDRITMGELPKLDGLYRSDAARTVGLKGASETPQRPHVFISHLHMDHMAALDYLAPEVPVYLHPESLRLLRAVAETGEGPGVPAGARSLPPGQPVQVGPIQVTIHEVDHDVPGAVGMLIETPDGTVVYTGDLRLHGAHPEKVQAFVQTARAARPRILLIEGTRLAEPEPELGWSSIPTESQVPVKVAHHLRENAGLALITFYPRNPERITRIAEAAAQSGRLLLLAPTTAHIWAAMGSGLGRVGLYLSTRTKELLASGAAPAWLRRLTGLVSINLGAEAVHQAPGRYLLELKLAELAELVDLAPPADSCFIHANGEPLGPFDPNYAFLNRWLERFGIAFRRAGSSGHASRPDLFRIAAAIQPDVLMPIHTLTPELFDVPGLFRILPERGATYDLSGIGTKR
jgi:ribonuclease J